MEDQEVIDKEVATEAREEEKAEEDTDLVTGLMEEDHMGTEKEAGAIGTEEAGEEAMLAAVVEQEEVDTRQVNVAQLKVTLRITVDRIKCHEAIEDVAEVIPGEVCRKR